MRGRLFWKILIAFWITFMLIVEGVWVVFALYGSARKPLDVRLAERLGRQQLAAAVAVLQAGGPAAVAGFVQTWPAEERPLLTMRPGPAPALPAPPPDQALPPLTATAPGPDGRDWHLAYDADQLRRDFHPPGWLNIPWHLVGLGILGGLIFSATLAWYLTRPIRRIRGGFAELAQGNLGVRLAPHLGRRRDELIDLARAFDQMAGRLAELMTARERMLHVVSHELRSPLARLHLAVGLLRQDPARLEATLERIELETRRLDEIVGEVLTLARVEAGAPPLDDYLDLGSLLFTVAADVRFEAQPAGVAVAALLTPEDSAAWPTVKGNAQLLRRALDNVVRNALQHSSPGQEVSLAARPDWPAKQFVILVSDQGPGLADQALENLFEPFVQGRGRADGQGFGLGLAIAQRAVLAHGGRIAAANRPEGGLEVQITLPFGPLG
ncbi:MAG: HAMP domain-containing protein [Deltaproteobacteria bacterium]|nr:HAMP domain-containing protein [Deltaproteobacteria bacterium]